MTTTGPHLSAADLSEHDPRARPWSRGLRARFCCPLPDCANKKVNASHRTLTVYPEGGWTCARCKAKGKLTDEWTDRPADQRRGRDAYAATFARVAPRTPDAPPDERGYDLVEEFGHIAALGGTSAALYLESRGIPAQPAAVCGVRFSPAWGSSISYPRSDGTRGKAKGGPAAVFPLRDQAGKVCGAQGRFTLPGGFWKDGPNKLTFKAEGVEEMGVFVTPGAFEAAAVVVVEAPIDALTLYLCGVPAIATVGTSCPAWLIERLGLRRVSLAHDADEAGDKAARAIADELAKYGAFCERLRPSGAKDWNEALKRFGKEALTAALAPPAPPAVVVDPHEEHPTHPSISLAIDAMLAPSEVQDYAKEGKTRERPPVAPRIVRFQTWPAIGSAMYWTFPHADRLEACAAAGLPTSYELHKMLDVLASDQATDEDRKAADRLREAVELEALSANPQRTL